MTEIQESIKQTTFDRASFIVGLSAALVALYPFKDTVGNMGMDLFAWRISLYGIALIFLGLLLLSAYLYGVNNIRYSIPKVLEWKWTRWLETLAFIVYTIAFLLPIFLLGLWPISFLIKLIPTDSRSLSIINSIVTIAGIGAFLPYLSYFIFKKKKDLLIEEMRGLQEKLRLETGRAYQAGDLRVSVLSLYQNFVSVLKSKLVERIGIKAQGLPDSQAIAIASDVGLIKSGDLNAVNDLKGMRNQIAHNINQIYLNKETFMEMNQRIVKIIDRMVNISL